MTPEELAALSPEALARAARDASIIETNAIAYASSLQVAQAGNDFVLTFARPRPTLTPDGQIAPFMKGETTAIVYLSVQTLKDFSIAISQHITRYEAEHGKIQSDFTRALAKL